jgi:predicted ArsR family transcriptional regulator
MGQNAIQRKATKYGQGRPRHHYWLTVEGLSRTGSIFPDVAITRWEKMHEKSDPSLCREMLRRIVRELAAVLRPAAD